MTSKVSKKDLEIAKTHETFGVIATIVAVIGFIFPALLWGTMVIGVILGGEARCDKHSTKARTLGTLAEIIVAIQILILYAFCISALNK